MVGLFVTVIGRGLVVVGFVMRFGFGRFAGFVVAFGRGFGRFGWCHASLPFVRREARDVAIIAAILVVFVQLVALVVIAVLILR